MVDIQTIEDYVRRVLPPEPTGHDWPHAFRVRDTAVYISGREGADIYVVERAALLHDVDDAKFSGDENGPGNAAKKYLCGKESENVVDHVVAILDNMSYHGVGVPDTGVSLEGDCVQDADRIDAIGPIGIARVFAYGASRDRLIYDPEITSVIHDSPESYRSTIGTSLNHFFEKLLHLKDRMRTNTGKELAEPLHEYMQEYVNRFLEQWEGI
ncbi:HD domain-containing protein [Candidatus Woesearchaeota archaeon]|nr:HD domain-containing protein [Candidatus Woesearchaeota archaeon]